MHTQYQPSIRPSPANPWDHFAKGYVVDYDLVERNYAEWRRSRGLSPRLSDETIEEIER